MPMEEFDTTVDDGETRLLSCLHLVDKIGDAFGDEVDLVILCRAREELIDRERDEAVELLQCLDVF